MRLHHRKITAPIAAAIAAAVLGSAMSTAPVQAAPPQIDWAPCEEDATAECGTLELPVDWTQPQGKKFELALARRKAADPARRIGSMLINPGGPGGSGVDYAIGTAPTMFSPEVRARFDIVGFDPRGIVRSNPVVCSREAYDKPGWTILPASQSEFDGLKAYNRQLGTDCKSHTGPLYDHVDSINVARDIDAIRAALGEPKISWFGSSYGTLMGQMYAEKFPSRVRAMVLDSNMDHSLTVKPFLLTEAAAVEDTFESFVDWCDADTRCGLHGQSVKSVWQGLLAKADAGTLTDPSDGHAVTNWELLDTTQFYLGRPRATQLGAWLASLKSGQPPTVKLASRPTRNAGRTAARTAGRSVTDRTRGQASEELVEDTSAQFCQDWSVPVKDYTDVSRLWSASRKVAPNMRASITALTYTMSCQGLPTKVTNPQHQLRVSGTPKLLVMNNLHDPATPYIWAMDAVAQLGDTAALATYKGWGHGTYRRSACTKALADPYLLALTVPPKGASCDAVPPEVIGLAPGSDSGAEVRGW